MGWDILLHDRADPRLAAPPHAGDALAVRGRRRHDGPRPREPLRARGRAAHRLLAVPLHEHARTARSWRSSARPPMLGRRLAGPGAAWPSTTTASTARSTRWSTSASATTTRSASTGAPCSRGPRRGWPTSTRPTLDRVVIARPVPAADRLHLQRPGGRRARASRVLDATECWIYQHGLRHMGEIELARGLVGLQGMTS